MAPSLLRDFAAERAKNALDSAEHRLKHMEAVAAEKAQSMLTLVESLDMKAVRHPKAAGHSIDLASIVASAKTTLKNVHNMPQSRQRALAHARAALASFAKK
jgi:glycyl-tRNA synthetase beta subunit